MELDYVVIVTKEGKYDCILDCGIVSLGGAKYAIKKAKSEDKQSGWQYEYQFVPVERANKSVEPTVSKRGNFASKSSRKSKVSLPA